jgi:hypothetical protein
MGAVASAHTAGVGTLTLGRMATAGVGAAAGWETGATTGAAAGAETTMGAGAGAGASA